MHHLRVLVTLGLVIIIPIVSIIMYLEWSRTNVTSNANKCTELTRVLEEHLINYNQSVDNYNYHVQALKGDFDLIGDLAVWYNQLENQQRYIEDELANLRGCPNEEHFTYNNVSQSITIR